jgi:hypothetical protein
MLLFPIIRLSEWYSRARYFSRTDQRLRSCRFAKAGKHPAAVRTVAVVTLFLGITGFSSCRNRALPALPELPEMVGALELKDTVAGVEANKFLYRMHGMVTGARNSIIGYYSLDKKNALYLSSFENDEQAERALQKMSAKIMHTTAGFTPVTANRDEGTVFYTTTGMGLNHFFYRQDTFVVWWQVEPDRAGDILSHARKVHYTIP